MQHLEAAKVDLFIEQQALDTTTPSGKLMFQLCGAFAEFERAMIRQRIMAGLKRTVVAGTKLGRKTIDVKKPRQVERARDLLAEGASIRTAVSATGLSIGTVHALTKE